MDAKLFAPTAPGRLVPALNKYRRPDTGFIPDPLPRSWEPPPATRALLVQARGLIERLLFARQGARAPQLASDFLQLREAICSSVSDRGARVTEALLGFAPPAAGTHRDPLKAWRQAYRYRAVLRAGHASLAGERPIALRALIQRIHAGLFEGKPRKGVYPGRLRRGPIQMGDQAHYVPPPYGWVVPCLAVLERDLARPSSIDPLLLAFMTHYQIATIHPFADGNGRVARILLALMLNRAPGLAGGTPLLYLSAYLVRHKKDYTGRQFRVNTHGEWPVWIDFCLKALIAEVRDGARRVALLENMRAKLLAKLGGPSGADALLDDLLVTPAFSEPQFASLCARHGREARPELERLLGAGIARVVDARIARGVDARIARGAGPRSRPRHFYLPGAVALLTRDPLPALKR